MTGTRVTAARRGRSVRLRSIVALIEPLELRCLLSGGVAITAAPPNDNLADATPLGALPVSLTATNAEATKEAGEPDLAGNSGGRSVWWSWTASVDGTVDISTAGSNFDTLLGVYQGTNYTNLTPVVSDDDDGNVLTSRVTIDAAVGQTYLIAVDGFGGDFGTIQFQMTLITTPANDNFADSIPLSGSNVSTTGSNVGATREVDEPDHAGDTGGHSVWWTWTAPGSGTFDISTAGSDFNTLLGVYTGTDLSTLSEVASNDDFGDSQTSLVSIDAIAGTEYHIAVDGYQEATGHIALAISSFVLPTNDDFANRIALTGSSVHTTGSSIGATAETNEPQLPFYGGGQSVWWSWTAPTSGRFTIDTAGSDFDTVMGVFTGSTIDTLTTIGDDDDGSIGVASAVTFDATAGTEYQVMIDGYGSNSGNIALEILPVMQIDGTDGNDTIRIVRDPSSDATQVFINNSGSTPDLTVPFSTTGALEINAGAGDDQIIVDFTQGIPVPNGGISIDGGTHSAGDTLELTGNGSWIDLYAGLATSRVYASSSPSIDFTGIEPVSISGFSAVAYAPPYSAAGTDIQVTAPTPDTLQVQGTAGAATIYPVTLPSNSELVVSGTGSVNVLSGTVQLNAYNAFTLSASGTSVVQLSYDSTLSGLSLSDQASLDLFGYNLVLSYPAGNSPADQLRQLVLNGIMGLSAPTITSTLDAFTIVGMVDNSLIHQDTWFGNSVSNDGSYTQMLLHPTVAGDSNLDDIVSDADLRNILANMGHTGTWFTGDVNYDGVVNADDFGIVATNLTGLPLATGPLTAVAATPAKPVDAVLSEPLAATATTTGTAPAATPSATADAATQPVAAPAPAAPAPVPATPELAASRGIEWLVQTPEGRKQLDLLTGNSDRMVFED